jgi:predicted AAA+ superfamily ATPase
MMRGKKMDIVSKVQDEISAGDLTWAQIAEKFNMSIWDVEMIFEEMMDQMAEAYDESMDGDFDTGNVRYKARERYSFGVSDPLGVFGSPGA